ncbi:hypothetical protein F2P81_017665 [Scophthalmus maximus]|uniref:Uncharacterized protein n=1 Tax=Scophthalmus maximus TaxID=52904 RepID=A0A6A4SIY6_SCOMX|nr:hypothetical protein F2P81_017665 [Scophthalmus maximus]
MQTRTVGGPEVSHAAARCRSTRITDVLFPVTCGAVKQKHHDHQETLEETDLTSAEFKQWEFSSCGRNMSKPKKSTSSRFELKSRKATRGRFRLRLLQPQTRVLNQKQKREGTFVSGGFDMNLIRSDPSRL